MLREEVAEGTPLGKSVDAIMRRGALVPSETIVTLLRRRMRAYAAQRLLIDGFPRSRQNAIDFAEQCGIPELALVLTCPEQVVPSRAPRRRPLSTSKRCGVSRADEPMCRVPRCR